MSQDQSEQGGYDFSSAKAEAISALEKRPSNKTVSTTTWGVLFSVNIAGYRLAKHSATIQERPSR